MKTLFLAALLVAVTYDGLVNTILVASAHTVSTRIVIHTRRIEFFSFEGQHSEFS